MMKFGASTTFRLEIEPSCHHSIDWSPAEYFADSTPLKGKGQSKHTEPKHTTSKTWTCWSIYNRFGGWRWAILSAELISIFNHIFFKDRQPFANYFWSSWFSSTSDLLCCKKANTFRCRASKSCRPRIPNGNIADKSRHENSDETRHNTSR